MSRLFIAIDLPERIRVRLSRLRLEIPGARWVPTDHLHLTLAFLGERDPGSVQRLNEELSAIRLPGFRLQLSSPGCFPNPAHPRVLWVGIEQEQHLNRLESRVRRALLECGIPPEERPFFPHITLARLTNPAGRAVSGFLHPPDTPKFPPLDVQEFVLYQSRLTPGGAIHTPLSHFPLSGGVPDGR